MWFERPNRLPDWSQATRHLAGVDRRLARVIERVGSCTLSPRRDYFVVLCQAIFTQQISTAVATTLFGRFRDLFPMRRPTPGLVLKALSGGEAGGAGLDVLKHCGLSRQKMLYLKDLAEHFADGRIVTRRIVSMSDEEVIETLVRVKGIGRWTAEMFLIFTLNRPDVLPVDDLGLRVGVQRLFNLPERPTAKRATELAAPWRPYRTIGTWYLWRWDAAEKKSGAKRRRPGRTTAVPS